MDRWLTTPGNIVLAEMLLGSFKNPMINSAMLAETLLGQSTQAYGLAATALSNTAVSGSAFAVSIGRGCIFAYETTDTEAYGVLGTDSTTIVKTGINLSAQSIGLTNAAPGTSGQSVNYLITAAFSEQDGSPQSVPSYNSVTPSNPTITASENTVRSETVALAFVAGTPATTGTQTTPAAPSGTIGLWVVTVHYGDTAVVTGQIAIAPGAPFPDGGYILSAVQNAAKRQVAFATPGAFSFTVPQGVYQLKATVTGGGGGGSDCSAAFPSTGTNNVSGGGGGAGGTTIGSIAVTPGQVITGVVGAGGTAQVNGSPSSFASLYATGGGGSSFQVAASSAGAEGGSGSGGNVNLMGGFGSDGQCGAATSFGNGGASYWGGGVRAYNAGGTALPANGAPGGGGGGSYNAPTSAAYPGTSGLAGIVVVEY